MSESVRREYPEMPQVGVGAAIVKDDRILLVQRGREPGCGLWALPGGRLELGETVKEAVEREVMEECGLVIILGEVLAVVDMIQRDEDGRVRFHYVLVDFLATPAGGELTVGSDILDARWVSEEELDELEMPPRARDVARQALRKVFPVQSKK